MKERYIERGLFSFLIKFSDSGEEKELPGMVIALLIRLNVAQLLAFAHARVNKLHLGRFARA